MIQLKDFIKNTQQAFVAKEKLHCESKKAKTTTHFLTSRLSLKTKMDSGSPRCTSESVSSSTSIRVWKFRCDDKRVA